MKVACQVLRPADVDALLPAADRKPEAPEPQPPGLEALAAPALAAVPVPVALAVSRLSYSGLAAYRRCGYRFYLDRALRLPPPDDAPARAARGAERRRTRCRPLVRGIGRAPAARGAGLRRSGGPPDAERVGRGDRGRAASRCAPRRSPTSTGMVDGFAASRAGARIGAAERVRAELPFAFTLDTGGGRSLLVDGIVDVHAAESRAACWSWTTRATGSTVASPRTRVEGAYATQRLVYALAALRCGAARAEVAYCFLERPDEPVHRDLHGRGRGAGARGRAARAGRRRVRGPLRAHRPAPPRPVRRLPRPPGAVQLGRGAHPGRAGRHVRVGPGRLGGQFRLAPALP